MWAHLKILFFLNIILEQAGGNRDVSSCLYLLNNLPDFNVKTTQIQKEVYKLIYKISLIDNAVDELDSIRCDLVLYNDIANSKEVDIDQQFYAIKRIIKQIDCAWELFMKYRLQIISWTLLFENPDTASIDDFQTGNFRTVKKNQACKHLSQNGITPSFLNLRKLAQYRNQIEHYQVDASLKEVLQTIVNAIDELSLFYADHIATIATDTRSINRGIKMLIEVQEAKDNLVALIDLGMFSNL